MNLIKIASAGSGKTWSLCSKALEMQATMANKKRVLLVTYTHNGKRSIESTLTQLDNCFPNERVEVKTLYDFLINEIIRPYQVLYFDLPTNFISGINFADMHQTTRFSKKDKRRYVYADGTLRSRECSEYAYMILSHKEKEALRRLEELYVGIFFDECQDLAGYDLEILKSLFHSTINIICVGDPKQATFRSNYSPKNKSYSGSEFLKFVDSQKKQGVVLVENATKSRRFNHWIALFANKIYPKHPLVSSIMDKKTEYDGVFYIHEDDVEDYFSANANIMQVLKYDKRTSTFNLPSINFGDSKGRTYDRVLIFPNVALNNFLFSNVPLTAPDKYYIGVTRARYSVVVVVSKIDLLSDCEQIAVTCGEKLVKLYKHPQFTR